MLCSDSKLDSHRFKDILDEAIAAGKIIPSFQYFDINLESFKIAHDSLNNLLFDCVGELKTTKAYQKWAKKVSAMKPPTSPLRKRDK